jgi:hypothetical protein
MDYGIAETGIARGSPPGTTTEVLRVGFPSAEIRFVSLLFVATDSVSYNSSFPLPYTMFLLVVSLSCSISGLFLSSVRQGLTIGI